MNDRQANQEQPVRARNRSIAAIVILWFAVLSCASSQQPGLITPVGIVHVVEAESGFAIKLDDRVLHEWSADGGLAPRLIQHFSDVGTFAEILVYDRYVIDTTCNSRAFFIVAVGGDGSAVVTDEVRHCTSLERRITQSGSRVTITLASPVEQGRRTSPKATTWVFDRGLLKKLRQR